jgi:1-acyl-sn-glycerol-3-phosphate acyltransferase
MQHHGHMPSGVHQDYSDLLADGKRLYPGVRIGRPGRSRAYWLTIACMRALRLKWAVTVEGAADVAPGASILVGNHVSALDPVTAVMSNWWRVTAFTKVEVFERRGAIFFRLMGQIPLRRGDEACTEWAMAMASRTLADGNKVGLYPEGTRSPDQAKLHRLHGRVLVPIIRANPDVAVHAISTRYPEKTRMRQPVRIRLSARLPIDPSTMTDDQIVDILREELLRLGEQAYVDESAATAKRRLARDSS